MWRPLVITIGLGCAGFLPAQSVSVEAFGVPPTDGVIQFASLGRDEAAGSVLWILATQQVGRRVYEEAGYPGLERWLEAVFRHSPHLSDAYTLGTVLLLTDRERASRMDVLLKAAEQRYPDVYEYPMLRGISAYFGALDAAAAADHFERASTRPKAPPYLAQFARRLKAETATCGSLVVNMKAMAQQDGTQGELLRGQIEGVYLRCIQRELEQAAAGFRLTFGRNATLDDLLESGYLKARPPAPPGQCWEVVGVDAQLVPCGPMLHPTP